MQLNPHPGKPAAPPSLVNVAKRLTAYGSEVPGLNRMVARSFLVDDHLQCILADVQALINAVPSTTEPLADATTAVGSLDQA